MRWDNVKIKYPGKYILTVEIPKSGNPITYNLSRRAASVSKSFAVRGGNGKGYGKDNGKGHGKGYDKEHGKAGYDLIVKLEEGRGTRRSRLLGLSENPRRTSDCLENALPAMPR